MAPSIKDVSWGLIPGLAVPDEAQPSFFLGYGLIFLSIFTTTYNNPLLKYVRLALAPPALWALWDYAFSGKYGPTIKQNIDMGMALLAIYGGLKIGEVCVFPLWLKEAQVWPQWVNLEEKRKEPTGKANGAVANGVKGVKKTDGGKQHEIIPFNPTLSGRMAYAYDQLSVRGSSWFRGRAWDFAPNAVLSQSPTPLPQFTFIIQSLLKVIECYIILDAIETVVYAHTWNTLDPRPITGVGMPIWKQFVLAFCVCVHTGMTISLPYGVAALLTSFAGAPSTAWPPMFDSPFAARSLAEFWSQKWHAIFRRVFDVWSYAILSIIPTSALHLKSRGRKFLRAVIIFLLSYTLHLFLLWAVPPNPAYPPKQFFNLQAAKFFIAQPIGLSIELLVVFPLTTGLSEPWKTTIRRTFAWGWLLFGGRYWSDAWYSGGQMGFKERYILYSPIRGLLWGNWVV